MLSPYFAGLRKWGYLITILHFLKIKYPNDIPMQYNMMSNVSKKPLIKRTWINSIATDNINEKIKV